MPQYLYQAAYTAESLAAQIKDPKDRIEVVRPDDAFAERPGVDRRADKGANRSADVQAGALGAPGVDEGA